MEYFKVFISLVIFLTQHVFAIVPSVADVRVLCQNQRNVLNWNYSQSSEQPVRFRVDLRSTYSPPKVLWVQSPDQHCDLSSSTHNLFNDYSVTVTAVVGPNQSEPAPPEPLSFSYDRDTLVDLYCSLDMPTVNVSVQSDHSISLYFLHPYTLYGGDKMEDSTVASDDDYYPTEEMEEDLTEFIFKVVTGDKREQSGHSCVERLCHAVVPLYQAEKKNVCVMLQGWMKSHLIGPQEFCTLVHHDSRGLTVALSVCSVGALLVLVSAGAMFCYKKTRGSNYSLPVFMIPKVKSMVRPPLNPESPEVSSAQTLSPGTTPLLKPKEEEEVVPIQEVSAPTHLELRLPCGVQEANVSRVAVLPSSSQSGSSCGGGSVAKAGQGDGYGKGMDEEEGGGGGYDRTHGLFPVEMAPEDVVQGYREYQR